VELGEGGTGKENDRESTILQYMASEKVQDIRMCIESY
jgi:hypothetical protein